MKIFQITIGEWHERKAAATELHGGSLAYLLPEDAAAAVEPILAPYNQSPDWYFDRLNHGRPPAPWAVVCFDREYRIAGHIAETRGASRGIAFSTYRSQPDPMPEDYVPGVGVLLIFDRSALEQCSSRSSVLAQIWDALKECSVDARWLLVMDALSPSWLDVTAQGDDDLWRQLRNRR